MDSSVRHVTERRLARRMTAIAELGIRQAKVRPGHEAAVLDISSNGVLIETSLRLIPGRQIELLIERGSQVTPVRGRVMRSQVARLQPSRVSYRGAIGFDNRSPGSVYLPSRTSMGFTASQPGDGCAHEHELPVCRHSTSERTTISRAT